MLILCALGRSLAGIKEDGRNPFKADAPFVLAFHVAPTVRAPPLATPWRRSSFKEQNQVRLPPMPLLMMSKGFQTIQWSPMSRRYQALCHMMALPV